MAETREAKVVLVTEVCISCGVAFGVPENWLNHRKKTHETFYCPNGHGQLYGGLTAEQREIQALKSRVQMAESNGSYWHQQAEMKTRSLRATRGVLTKTRKRIAAGVCPCCHRTFQQLAQHMANQHPEYPPAAADEQGE